MFPARLFLMLLVSSMTPYFSESRAEDPLVRSASSGVWSDPATWVGAKIPEPGDRVQIRTGHLVVFDSKIEKPIRSIHIAGTLTFDPDRDTLLSVGLIKIEAGNDPTEVGLNEHHAMSAENPVSEPASLLVGRPERPIRADHTAVIRLALVDGLDPESCPAIVCRGGRMDFHGSPLQPTWTKLRESVQARSDSVVVDRPVEGWKPGDRVIITSTRHQYAKDDDRTPKVKDAPQTEERIIRAIDGHRLTLDAALSFTHSAEGRYRGEVANLSRNVVVESANPEGVRGHTMYHHGSTGSISFAEFRHLGKAGKLGKYSLHFHKVGDSMRGTSVLGASIWDSANRWITIHATNRLLIRDCVGYRSAGHGFFFEDGTEVDNILDGNLAVQALDAPKLPGQALGFDQNDGAGFWWANSRNAFVRNVAVECETYGFRFDPGHSSHFNSILPIRGHDGRTTPEDIRLLPFLRFDANEAHSQRRYGVNLGGDSSKVSSIESKTTGPDSSHPLTIRDLRVWESHFAFTPATPGLIAEGLDLAHSDYGFWRPYFERQAYQDLRIFQCRKGYSQILGRPPEQRNFPAPLTPVDDRPPVTVITAVEPTGSGKFRVSGSSVDDGRLRAVRVNGIEAKAIVDDFSRWESMIELDRDRSRMVVAEAEDLAGNREQTPHIVPMPIGAGILPRSPNHSHQPH